MKKCVKHFNFTIFILTLFRFFTFLVDIYARMMRLQKSDSVQMSETCTLVGRAVGKRMQLNDD